MNMVYQYFFIILEKKKQKIPEKSTSDGTVETEMPSDGEAEDDTEEAASDSLNTQCKYLHNYYFANL